ncbi:AI-2E family transporter [Aerophototrophica crusticola]|uniref:AI-2E family transporter n=1 Tax=Aerophototrophica crusticola TaxID=1709002 RepID=A0A858R6L5_9PROT|nr:AI-2E family transporter [Rhodospirillaceae bacterium B3]
MTSARQVRFWLIGFAVFAVLLWLLRDVLGPFVAGMAVAYLLDPLVDRLERAGLPRWLATTVVLLSFVFVVLLVLVLLFPLLRSQVVQAVQGLPNLVAWVKGEVLPRVEAIVATLSPEDVERLRTAVGEYAGTVVGWATDLVRGVLSGGVAIVDVISVLLITPVVAFYLLRDWDKLVGTVDSWLPRPHAETIREQAREVDSTLAGFVRGQASVCVVLGLFYALALSAVGLDFGLIIGLFSGLLSFIPYVGSLVGFVSSVGVAFFQYDELWRVGLVAGIFILGQAVEGNVLTPKLVGDKVGLHPVWIMFALLAAGSLFGFVGVLLAVPVAAVIGVLVRFGLKQYMASPIYTGRFARRTAPETVAVFPAEMPLAGPAGAEHTVTRAPADVPGAP